METNCILQALFSRGFSEEILLCGGDYLKVRCQQLCGFAVEVKLILHLLRFLVFGYYFGEQLIREEEDLMELCRFFTQHNEVYKSLML